MAGVPALNIERPKLEVCVGQKCVMNVNIEANPEIYAVRWLKIKNGKPVKLPECSRYSAVTVDQPSLEISNAVKSDEGVYRCQATNDYGSGRSRDIFLQIIGNVLMMRLIFQTLISICGILFLCLLPLLFTFCDILDKYRLNKLNSHFSFFYDNTTVSVGC